MHATAGSAPCFSSPLCPFRSLSLHFQPPTNPSQTWDFCLAFVLSLLTHRLNFLVLCHTFMWDDADARYNASTLPVTFLNSVGLARAASSNPQPSACHNGSSCWALMMVSGLSTGPASTSLEAFTIYFFDVVTTPCKKYFFLT